MDGFAGAGISAVLLFGSRAREDNGRGSDTDLLLVSSAGKPQHKSIGHLSMFLYPWPKLTADAKCGDLFVCHLAREAKALFDPADRLGGLRSAFRLRADYSREAGHASDLGWMLDRHAEALSPAAVARRMVWCVRTTLIIRTAERGDPAFAPSALAAAATSPATVELLDERHQRRADAAMRRRFRQFLADEAGQPPLAESANLADYRTLFEVTGNAVALRTLETGDSKEQGYT